MFHFLIYLQSEKDSIDDITVTEAKTNGLLLWWRRNTNNKAVLTDLVSRILFPLSFVIFNVTYWMYYYVYPDRDLDDEWIDVIFVACFMKKIIYFETLRTDTRRILDKSAPLPHKLIPHKSLGLHFTLILLHDGLKFFCF